MKILFLSEYSPLPKYDNGTSIRIFNFLEQLKRKNINYIFYTLQNNKTKKLDCLFNVKYISDHKDLFSLNKYNNKAFVSELDTIISSNDPSHIIIEGMTFAVIPKKYDPITIINVVDCLSLVMLKKLKTENFINLKTIIKLINYLYFERYVLSKYNNLVVVSNQDAKFLSKTTKSRINIIPNGYDESIFDNGNLKIIPTLFFLGNFSGYMNTESVNYILKNISDKAFTKFGFNTVLAGKNIPENLIEAFKKTPHIKFLPNVESLNEIYNKYKIFICAIEYGTGIKNSILNAIASNNLIICSKTIALEHNLTHKHNCLIYQDRSKIIKLIEDNLVLINTIKIDNTDLLKNFSWNENVNKTINLVGRK